MIIQSPYGFFDWRLYRDALGPSPLVLLTILYAGILVIGLPLYLVFELFRLRAAWLYALFGFVIGFSLLTIAQAADPGSDYPAYVPAPEIDWIRSFWFGITGMIVTLVFWYVRHANFQRRPDLNST